MEHYTTSEDELSPLEDSAEDSDGPIFLARKIPSDTDSDSLEKAVFPATEQTALLAASSHRLYSKNPSSSSLTTTSLSKIDELALPKVIYASPAQPQLPSPSSSNVHTTRIAPRSSPPRLFVLD